MKGIRFDSNGNTLIFGPEGDVARLVNGNTVTVGNWQTESSQRDNQVRYDINGIPQAPIPIQHQFNQNNQLVSTLRKPDGTLTDPFTFIGFIEVDESTDVIFTLITGEGATMSRNVIVYGALTFDSSNFLNIDLIGGGSARIRGDGGAQAIQALANLSDPQANTGDMLKFNASTVNQLASGKKKSFPAKIQINGNWTVANNSLVFNATHDSDTTQISFAGKFNGVAAGFAYSTDPTGTKIGFVVSGQHTWNSGSSSWDVSVGFSQNTFQAHLNDATKIDLPNGAVAIQGKLDIVGKNVTFDFNLQARFTFNQANMLVFTADVHTTPGGPLNYDLKLEGSFNFDGLQLTFAAKVSNTADSLTFTLATSGNQDALKLQLSVTLDITPGAVNLGFTFTLTMHFVDGKLVKDPATPTQLAHAQVQ
jgi:hypothetical protein